MNNAQPFLFLFKCFPPTSESEQHGEAKFLPQLTKKIKAKRCAREELSVTGANNPCLFFFDSVREGRRKKRRRKKNKIKSDQIYTAAFAFAHVQCNETYAGLTGHCTRSRPCLPRSTAAPARRPFFTMKLVLQAAPPWSRLFPLLDPCIPPSLLSRCPC